VTVRYWHRKRDSRGQWWSVYLASPDSPELVCHGEVAGATTWLDKRKIYLNTDERDTMGGYARLLLHEWCHVELTAHGVFGHIAQTPLHNAITEIAEAHYRKTCTPPPRTYWTDQ
jgi:hypothetical protein